MSIVDLIRSKSEHIRTVLLPGGSIRGRMARGAFWSATSTVAAQIFGFAVAVVTARILGDSTLGHFGIIRSTVELTSILGGLGLGLTAIRHAAELRDNDPDRAGRILGLSMLVTAGSSVAIMLALLAAAPWVDETFLKAEGLAVELRLVAPLLVFNMVNGVQIGALGGLEAFRSLAIANAVRACLNVPITVVGVSLFGLQGAVVAMVASSMVGVSISHYLMRKECAAAGIRISYLDAWQERRVLSTFALPAFITTSFVTPVVWLGNTTLFRRTGGDAEMGVFYAAYQWRTLLLFVPGVLGRVALPMLANLHGDGDVRRYRRLFWGNLGIVMAVVTAICIPISLASRGIMSLYGEGFGDGAYVLVLICLSTVFYTGVGVANSAIASMGRMWGGAAMSFMWACTFMTSAYFLIDRGAVGLAACHAIAYGVQVVASLGYTVYLMHRYAGRGSVGTDTPEAP
ncbi:MAG TPA: oligosaccharide flippase family protein [Armatimonadota bacterium]|nr:oligosaccharide flippase family protein [Armatimonadota bacterium]